MWISDICSNHWFQQAKEKGIQDYENNTEKSMITAWWHNSLMTIFLMTAWELLKCGFLNKSITMNAPQVITFGWDPFLVGPLLSGFVVAPTQKWWLEMGNWHKIHS